MSDIGGLLPPQLPKLRCYARLLARDKTDAEDPVQRCLVRALGLSQSLRLPCVEDAGCMCASEPGRSRILSAIAEKLKRRSKDDLSGRGAG